MAKITLRKLCEQSENPALVRAVVRQMGGYENFINYAPDVVRHGASGGYGRFIYYKDTVPFGFKWRDAILKQWQQIASECGTNALQDIAANKFVNESPDYVLDALRCTRKKAFDYTDIYNLFAWAALEDVARLYCDILEGSR